MSLLYFVRLLLFVDGWAREENALFSSSCALSSLEGGIPVYWKGYCFLVGLIECRLELNDGNRDMGVISLFPWNNTRVIVNNINREEQMIWDELSSNGSFFCFPCCFWRLWGSLI